MGLDLISIIVPVYNVEKYIEECIISLLSQSYENIEVILVDDGSTDNCGKICDDYAGKDKRIKVFHKQNGGVSSARNLGIKNANGDFIMFVDSDDWIEDFAVERMLQHIIKNNTDGVFSLRYIKDGKIIEDGKALSEGIYLSSEIIKRHIRGDFIAASYRSIIRKKLIEDCFFDTSIYNYEDWEYNFRVLKKLYKIFLCNDVYYNYRTVIGSASKSSISKKHLTCFLIYYKVNDILKKEDSELISDIGYMALYILRGMWNLLANSKYSLQESKAIRKFARDNFYEIIKLKDVKLKHKVFLSIAIVSPWFLCLCYRVVKKNKNYPK